MLLYSLIYCLLLPIFIIRTLIKDAKSLKQKLGFGYQNHHNCIHIHCVSVGEFNASIPLINKLRINNEIIITTTTKTGASACKKYYKNQITHYYFPFDLPMIVNHFIKKINPKISIILETEIWPNFINICDKHKLKILLINARLSDKSFKKYNKINKISHKIMSKFALITTQDELSYTNFKKIGLDNLQMLGNLKFDINPITNTKKLTTLKNIIQDRTIVVCASTHSNEEKLLIKAYLKKPCSQLLVLIPRHPERFSEVENMLKNYQVSYIKQNADNLQKTQNPISEVKVLLANSMGYVLEFYALCDIAFIGGSLVNAGGHNMLEAIAFKKLVIFGQYTFNFNDISQKLIERNAGIQISDANELFKIINTLDKEQEKYQTITQNATKFVKENIGASDKLTQIITSYW